jgi:hypothetical protein
MLVVVTDDFHLLANLAEQSALLLPPLAPAAEIALELRLMFAAIVIIIAIELAHLALAPTAIMRVEVALVPRAVGPVRGASPAGAAIFVAAPRRPGPVALAVIVAEPALAAADAAGGEELLGLVATAVIAGQRAIIATAVAEALPVPFAALVAARRAKAAFAHVTHADFAAAALGHVIAEPG